MAGAQPVTFRSTFPQGERPLCEDGQDPLQSGRVSGVG